MFSKGDSETGAVGTTRARAARRPALQRAAAALIAVIIAAALVGCSGDDDSGGDTTTTTTTPLVIPTTVPITIPALGSPDPADAQHAGEVALVADDLPEGWEDMGDLADDLAFLPRGAEECKPLEPFVATGAMSARVVSPRFASEQAVAGLVGYVQVYADEGSAEAALAAFAAGRTGACLARALEASVTTTGPAQVQPLTMAPTPSRSPTRPATREPSPPPWAAPRSATPSGTPPPRRGAPSSSWPSRASTRRGTLSRRRWGPWLSGPDLG
ncbi:MAG: hypothetical protein M5T61_05725 [Acidimicrobiia bacterium]|nr:hypothetical protein [Acidimicrobiia bacterium]